MSNLAKEANMMLHLLLSSPGMKRVVCNSQWSITARVPCSSNFVKFANSPYLISGIKFKAHWIWMVMMKQLQLFVSSCSSFPRSCSFAWVCSAIWVNNSTTATYPEMITYRSRLRRTYRLFGASRELITTNFPYCLCVLVQEFDYCHYWAGIYWHVEQERTRQTDRKSVV